MTYNHTHHEVYILSTLVNAKRGWTHIGEVVQARVQYIGDQLTNNLDARLVQYVGCTRQSMGDQQYYHMTTDEAFASSMRVQNTLISIPDNRAALALPQATGHSQNAPF